MSVTLLDNGSFNTEVKSSKLPVLVDFYADWCGPCRSLSPVIEKLAKKYEGKLKVCKINVDEADEIAGTYNVSSIPTVMLFQNGRVVDQFLGALPEPLIEDFIKKNI
jgi:thioredoxin 1